MRMLPSALSSLYALGFPKILDKYKGRSGEKKVTRTFKKLLNSDKYLILTNDNIPNPKVEKCFSQVDHIVLSEYGIFVIETKNWSGWIFGNKENKHWTVVYKGGSKRQMYNPVRQNWGHIYALVNFLNIPKEKFHNIVCFIGSAEFKTPIPEFCTKPIGAIKYIKSFTDIVLTKSEVSSVYNKIIKTRKPLN